MKYSPAALWILTAMGLCAQNQSTNGESTLLELGEAIERKLAGGQSHEYHFSLHAGEYARIAIEQRTIRVTIEVFEPDRKKIFAGDTYAIGEPQPAEVIAGATGLYRLRISASESTAPVGNYAVMLHDIEGATERHRNRVDANTAIARGVSLAAHQTREGLLKGVDSLEQALAHWRVAEDRFEQARTIARIGLLYIELGNREKAFEYAAQALPVAQAAGDDASIARAHNMVGEVHHSFGDRSKAIEHYERALALFRTAGNSAGEGRTLSNLGVAYSGTGEKRKALELFNRAVVIFRELRDRGMLAEVAGNMGMTYDRLGEYQRALESHQFELALQRELQDRASEAIALNNTGSAYSGLGEYQKALDAYTSALDINRLLDNRWNIGVNLNNIAWVYASLGDNQRALRFYQEALGNFRVIHDQRRVAATLNNIANVYLDLGDYRNAIEIHSQALPLRRAVGDTDGEANSLNNLGNAYAKLGNRQKASEHFERALTIHRIAGDRYMLARTLRNLGALTRETGDYEQAQTYLDEALHISRDIHDRSGEAATLADLARIERARGNLARSRERADQALTSLNLYGAPLPARIFGRLFFASVRGVQELSMEVLMRLHAEQPGRGFDAAALQVSESSRARSLMELLTESGAEIRRGVDQALLGRERDLTRLVSAKAIQQTTLMSTKHRDAEVIAAEKELDALTAELEQVQSRIRETSPQYAALTQPAPLNVQELQTRVLDDDTVLLEYALGAEKSFLWAVTTTSIASFELPARAEIESAARYLYEFLTARNRTPKTETAAARASRIRQADQATFNAAMKVSRILLGPVALRNKKQAAADRRRWRSTVLAVRFLTGARDRDRIQRSQACAVVNHEIITAPSASVIAILRQEMAGRTPRRKL